MRYDEAVKILNPSDEEDTCVHLRGAGMGCDFAEYMVGLARFHLIGHFSLQDLEAMVAWGHGPQEEADDVEA